MKTNSLVEPTIPEDKTTDTNISEDIHIRPQFRYIFIISFLPIVIYCVAFAALFMLPAAYHWAYDILVGVLTLSFLFILWSLLVVFCTSWTLTNDQLCYKRGVIARRIDYLELYRVTDYVVRETVPERLLGLSSFYLLSTDMSSPVTHIFGIPNLSDLQKEIRKRVEHQRKSKRIYEIGNNS